MYIIIRYTLYNIHVLLQPLSLSLSLSLSVSSRFKWMNVKNIFFAVYISMYTYNMNISIYGYVFALT